MKESKSESERRIRRHGEQQEPDRLKVNDAV